MIKSAEASFEKDYSLYLTGQGQVQGRVAGVTFIPNAKCEFEGVISYKDQLIFLIETSQTYSIDGKVFPKTIEYRVTFSWHEKGKLRKMVFAIEGRSLTDEELSKYDIKALLGKYINMSIVHKTSKTGKVRSEIASFMGLFAGQQLFTPLYTPWIFSFDTNDCDYLEQMLLLSDDDKRMVSYNKKEVKETQAYKNWLIEHPDSFFDKK